MNKVYANFWMTFVATKEKNIAFALSNTAKLKNKTTSLSISRPQLI